MAMDFITHLLLATLLGALIGLERQWRQRFAGLRTNALVAAGAAAFVGAGLSLNAGGNLAPMLGQVISGIGFLGAGVIFKEDFNVRGLNTAATIWCSAAVGMLAGLNLPHEAAGTAAVVISTNMILRPLVRKLGQMPAQKDSESPVVYGIHMVGTQKSEARLRSLLVQSTNGSPLSLKNLHSEKKGTGQFGIAAEFTIYGRNDRLVEEVAGRMSLDPAVKSLHWELVRGDQSLE
jgi:putative Mg2+ transporter-C (MgtC) family protein